MMTVTITGLEKLHKGLKRMHNKAPKAMRGAVRDTAKEGQRLARDIVKNGSPRTGRMNKARGYRRSAVGEPLKYDTGELYRSIQRTSRGLNASFGTNKDYAEEHEFGLNGRPPRPFMLPASFTLGEDARFLLKEHIKEDML